MAVSQVSSNVIKMTAAADSITGKKLVSYIRWVGATTAGHSLVVKDAAGNEIMKSVADGNYFIDIQPVFQVKDGVVATTMQSGELYVYVR